MKGLLLKDLYNVKGFARQYVIIILAMAVWSGICSVSESSENECDGDSTDADEQCKDDGNRDTDTGF